jgi:hypothetical protein
MVEKCHVVDTTEVGLPICCVLFYDTVIQILYQPVIDDSE